MRCGRPCKQDATLNAAAGRYQGLDRFKARKQLWADMEAAGLVLKKENYTVRCVCVLDLHLFGDLFGHLPRRGRSPATGCVRYRVLTCWRLR